MNHLDFRAEVLDTLRYYWRVRAAVALFKRSNIPFAGKMQYSAIPQNELAHGFLSEETVENALTALTKYSRERLARDIFIILIARFEARLIAKLEGAGEPGDGTLGNIQTKIQRIITVPIEQVCDLDEIRERRNVLIHLNGQCDAKYRKTAQKVNPRAGANVIIPEVGELVLPSDAYLTYAAAALIRYSATLESTSHE